MTAPGFSGGVLLAGALLLLTGCQHAPPDTGGSSFAFVSAAEQPVPPPKGKVTAADPTAPRTSDDFREAEPVYPLATPVYPPKALKARAGLATVGVRLTVDTAGRVSDVEPSILPFSMPGPFAEDFLEAVKMAVRQWRFRPAKIQHIEFVSPPGMNPFSRVLSSEKAETHLDVSFTFTATGGVLTR